MLLPGVRVGAGAFVHRAVVDQDAIIGVAARVGDPWGPASEAEAEGPVTVVGEGSWILSGSVVEPSDVVPPFSGRGELTPPSLAPASGRRPTLRIEPGTDDHRPAERVTQRA